MNSKEKDKHLISELIDLELVKHNIKYSGAKKFLPIVVLAVSLYYSAWLALGLIFGYLASKIFSKHLLDCGKIKRVWINLGKWKLHLHHWITASVVLLIAWYLDYFYLHMFFVGFMFGVIFHDIYDYDDWKEVFVKKEEK